MAGVTLLWRIRVAYSGAGAPGPQKASSAYVEERLNAYMKSVAYALHSRGQRL